MSEMIFQNQPMLMLLPIVVVFIAIYRMRMTRRKQDIRAFGEDAAWRGTEHRPMEFWRLWLLVGAVVLIILALTRPAANPHPKLLQKEGRDVVFLLDVSNSMMAEDRLPNRLQSAKLSIGECVSGLQGHRVGLVVFAGSSSIACPLTTDKKFFFNSLEKAGQETVAHGGTRIGDALLKVCDKIFADSDEGYKDIVLLTDGGDHSKSLSKALETINEKQVKLIVIGLGDEKKGARIPQVGTKSDYMIYQDQEIWTKLDTAQLTQMVRGAEQGAFLAVGTRQMELGEIYQRISEQAEKQQMAEESVISYDEIFQVFIAAALTLLVAMIMIPHTLSRRLKKQVVSLSVFMIFGMETAPGQVDSADAAFEKRAYAEALELYEVASSHSESALVWYKKGNTQYRLAQFSEAALSYEKALQYEPNQTLIRDVTYNLGNSYFQAAKNAQDIYAAVSLVNQSVIMYRRVMLQYPSDQDAAVNMELAKIERRTLQKKIAEDEKRRQEMKVALHQLRQLLEQGISAQAENLKLTVAVLATEPIEFSSQESLREKEKRVFQITHDAIKLTDDIGAQFFHGVSPEFNPFTKTAEHLFVSCEHELMALDYIMPQLENAIFHQNLALSGLQSALDALPRDPDSADEQVGESEESEAEGEEGDGEGEGDEGDKESDGEDGNNGDSEPTQHNKMTLDSMEIPPPNDSAEDVIRKSAAQQQARQSGGSRKKGKPVEKDW